MELWFLLPVAHRFPLGCTLICEILFLSSAKLRVIEDVMVTYETKMKENMNTALQLFVKVPFIVSYSVWCRLNSLLFCYFGDSYTEIGWS